MTEKTKNTKSAEDSASSGDEGERGSGPASVQQLVDMGSSTVKNARGTIHCLTIVGQVEGHMLAGQGTKTTKYEHVMPLLAALEGSEDVDGLLLLLNTVGGDIEAGLGIAELVAGMSKPTVSLVLGGSHSIGVPLAVSAKTSFAVPSAAMTIHPVRMNGTVIAAPQTYNYFDRLQERIVAFVVKNSHISREKFLELMLKTGEMAADVGSVLYGEEAVSLGLIDRVGGLSDALEDLYGQIAREKKDE
jgi:Protease subunit of ATP-dependent Clp proteases